LWACSARNRRPAILLPWAVPSDHPTTNEITVANGTRIPAGMERRELRYALSRSSLESGCLSASHRSRSRRSFSCGVDIFDTLFRESVYWELSVEYLGARMRNGLVEILRELGQCEDQRQQVFCRCKTRCGSGVRSSKLRVAQAPNAARRVWVPLHPLHPSSLHRLPSTQSFTPSIIALPG
jgi:hypothetical protein